jgi:myosin heavy subunit
VNGNVENPTVNDLENFERVKESFERLRFSANEINSIFKILSGILLLGNVDFAGTDKVRFSPLTCSSVLTA